MNMDELREVAAQSTPPKRGGSIILPTAFVVAAAAMGAGFAFLPGMISGGAVAQPVVAARTAAQTVSATGSEVLRRGLVVAGEQRMASIHARAEENDLRREAADQAASAKGGFERAYADCRLRYHKREAERQAKRRTGDRRFDQVSKDVEAMVKAQGLNLYPHGRAIECVVKRHRAALCDGTFRSEFNKLVTKHYTRAYRTGYRIPVKGGPSRSKGMAKHYENMGARMNMTGLRKGKSRTHRKPVSTDDRLRKLAGEGRLVRSEFERFLVGEPDFITDLFGEGIKVRSRCAVRS